MKDVLMEAEFVNALNRLVGKAKKNGVDLVTQADAWRAVVKKHFPLGASEMKGEMK